MTTEMTTIETLQSDARAIKTRFSAALLALCAAAAEAEDLRENARAAGLDAPELPSVTMTNNALAPHGELATYFARAIADGSCELATIPARFRQAWAKGGDIFIDPEA